MSIKKTLIGLVGIISAFSSNAALIEVSQGSTTLGYIDAFTGSQTAVQNWNKNGDPDIGPGGIANTAQFFFYTNPADGITFNMLMDDNGGATGRLSLIASVNNSGSDAIALLGDDSFSEFNETNVNDVFAGNWRWVNCCTDGGIIGGLSGKWSITMDITSSTNVNDFLIQSLGSTIEFTPGQSVTFSQVNAPSIGIALLMGLGFVAARRFR